MALGPGVDPASSFKTLVTVALPAPYVVCCVPWARRGLDFRRPRQPQAEEPLDASPPGSRGLTGYDARGTCRPWSMKPPALAQTGQPSSLTSLASRVAGAGSLRLSEMTSRRLPALCSSDICFPGRPVSDTRGWKPEAYHRRGGLRPVHQVRRPFHGPFKATESTGTRLARNAALGLLIVGRITGFFPHARPGASRLAPAWCGFFSVANNRKTSSTGLSWAACSSRRFYAGSTCRSSSAGEGEGRQPLHLGDPRLHRRCSWVPWPFSASSLPRSSCGRSPSRENLQSDFDADFATYLFGFFVVEVVLYSLSSIFLWRAQRRRDYFWVAQAPSSTTVSPPRSCFCVRRW